MSGLKDKAPLLKVSSLCIGFLCDDKPCVCASAYIYLYLCVVVCVSVCECVCVCVCQRIYTCMCGCALWMCWPCVREKLRHRDTKAAPLLTGRISLFSSMVTLRDLFIRDSHL